MSPAVMLEFHPHRAGRGAADHGTRSTAAREVRRDEQGLALTLSRTAVLEIL